MAKKILIVEDDPGILLSLKDEFEAEGYSVCTSDNGERALDVAGDENPDLIILDLMLPGLDGYEVCKRLRARNDFTPIIMLTVKDKEIDKVLGLELGADDYLTKPFSLRELTARVKAVLRRTEARQHDVTHYRFGQIDLDFKRYEAKRKGTRLELTPLEFQMLRLFIEQKEHVLSRDEILDRIWGKENLTVSHRTVDSHISNIRKKIEEDPSRPRHILGIRGVGYKFVD